MDCAQVQKLAEKIRRNVQTVIVGKDGVIDQMIVALLCSGHVLLEDVPGTGKTMLAKAFAGTLGLKFSRVQFTPDMLPSDLTGINTYNQKTSEFVFQPGPVFANVILADEINRATPKTQAGMLECMEERQVTVDTQTHALAEPFLVIATQNPVETLGTFPLPEAQLDRFLLKIGMQYPTHEESMAILSRFHAAQPLEALQAVVTPEEIRKMKDSARNVFVHNDLMDYAARIAEETRRVETVALGVSPRGMLCHLKAAQAFAAMQGRNYVRPDDLKATAISVLSHRLILRSAARLDGRAAADVLGEILGRLPVPTESVKGWAQP